MTPLTARLRREAETSDRSDTEEGSKDVSENETLPLMAWSEPEGYDGYPGSTSASRKWRILLTGDGADTDNDGKNVHLIVQRTKERHLFAALLTDEHWETISTRDYPGGALMAALLEWGVPLPPPVEQRDEV